nr:thiamine phosphate synthase [Nitratireductor basaltis]
MESESQHMQTERCRLVLITPDIATVADVAERLQRAVDAGDVASVIIPDWGMDEDQFQDHAAALSKIAQEAGAASLIAGAPRVAARIGADGIHVDGNRLELDDAIRQYQNRMIVGSGGARTRDVALDLGEAQPDYMFFGRFGYDNTPEPHPRNITLGTWWAQMIEVPCIVMAGSDPASIRTVAETGTEFVAASQIVFGSDVDAAEAVRNANNMLDQAAASRTESES